MYPSPSALVNLPVATHMRRNDGEFRIRPDAKPMRADTQVRPYGSIATEIVNSNRKGRSHPVGEAYMRGEA